MLCGSSAAGHVERLLSFQVTGVHDTWNRSCRTGLSNGRGTPEVPVGRISPPAFRAHWHLGLGASHFLSRYRPAIWRWWIFVKLRECCEDDCAGYVLSLYAYLITPLGVPQGYIRVNYRQWPSTVVIQSIILIIDYQDFLCTW